MEQNGDFKAIRQNEMLLFVQGFWFEYPKPDLNTYLQYFNPSISLLLVKYRLLRLTLWFLSHSYSLYLLITIIVQIVYLCPMGIVVFWDSKISVVENMYALVVYSFVLTTHLCVLYNKRTYRSYVAEMMRLSRAEQLQDEAERRMINRTNVWSQRITVFLNYIVVPVLAVFITLASVFYLVPNKRFLIRDWYPWDTSTSPAYELTLVARNIDIIGKFLQSNTLLSAFVSNFLYLKTHFDIMHYRIINMRSIAIKRIKTSRLLEAKQVTDNISVGIESNDGRLDLVLGRALTEDRAVQSCINARRTENRPLHQESSVMDRPFRGDRAVQPSINVRWTENRPLHQESRVMGGPLRGDRAVQPSINVRWTENRPFHQESRVMAGPSFRGDRAVQPGINARRIDNLVLFRPLYEESSVMAEPLLRGDRGVQPGRNARRIDNLVLFRPLYEESSVMAGPSSINVRRTENRPLHQESSVMAGPSSINVRRTDNRSLHQESSVMAGPSSINARRTENRPLHQESSVMAGPSSINVRRTENRPLHQESSVMAGPSSINVRRTENRPLNQESSVMAGPSSINVRRTENRPLHQESRVIAGPSLRGDRGLQPGRNARRTDNLVLFRPLYEESSVMAGPSSINVRRTENRPLHQESSVMAGPSSINVRRTENRPLHQESSVMAGPSSINVRRTENRPLHQESSVMARPLRGDRAVQPGRNARRIDNLVLFRPLYEESSVMAEPLLRGDRGVQPGRNARRTDNPLPLYERAHVVVMGENVESQLTEDQDTLDEVVEGTPASLDEEKEPTDDSRDVRLDGITADQLDREMMKVLGEIVELHVDLTKQASSLGLVLNAYFLMLFLTNVLILAVTTMVIAKAEITGVAVFAVLLFTTEIISVNLMYNYMGDSISQQNAVIRDEIYNIDWTGASPSFKKSMLIVMSRTNVPLEIKPTGLDPISLRNFGEVTKMAYNMISNVQMFVK